MNSGKQRHILGWVIALTLIFIIGSTARAERATIEEMDQVCQNWLSRIVTGQGNWAGSSSPSVERINEFIVHDTIMAMCYQISPDGWILIPVLKELPPIQAYSEEGHFDVNQQVGMVEMIGGVLQNRISNFVKQNGSVEATSIAAASDNHLSSWAQYTQSTKEFKSYMTSLAEPMETVGPLLTTSWDQIEPYNNLAPLGVNSGKTLVGCVATGASQLMAYYQWPPEGLGSYQYYWDGDNSCDGETPTGGRYLKADFDDPYDWDNMPATCYWGCTPEQEAAVSELCYEVGVAFSMDYGVCASGAYAQTDVLPTYFRYLPIIDQENRSSYDPQGWFDIIKYEIDQNRPYFYYIYKHMMVGDGWQTVDALNQIHINYGWGGTKNTWYTIDNLFCNWEGCSFYVEYIHRFIQPDKRVYFTCDTTVGWAPLEVQFTGYSELSSVDGWLWDFDNGDNSAEQSPLYTYQAGGVHDVTLQVTSGGENYSYLRRNCIIALADTLAGQEVEGEMDSVVEITINAVNNVPLDRIQLPIEYGGDLNLQYLGHVIEGCRTAGFDTYTYINYDSNNKRFTLDFIAGDADPMPPGEGPIIKLKFKIRATGAPVVLEMDGYNSYEPRFYGATMDYQPALVVGKVKLPGCCIGFRGNTDCSPDEAPDVSDIVRIIDYLYLSHDPLCCLEEADVDGSGGDADISDIVRIIDFLYLSHDPIVDCP